MFHIKLDQKSWYFRPFSAGKSMYNVKSFSRLNLKLSLDLFSLAECIRSEKNATTINIRRINPTRLHQLFFCSQSFLPSPLPAVLTSGVRQDVLKTWHPAYICWRIPPLRLLLKLCGDVVAHKKQNKTCGVSRSNAISSVVLTYISAKNFHLFNLLIGT